MSVTRHRRHTS